MDCAGCFHEVLLWHVVYVEPFFGVGMLVAGDSSMVVETNCKHGQGGLFPGREYHRKN